MFPFWEVAVAPVLEAAEARRLVEIGALRGETTRLMIDRLGPETELHVIDPLPDFDPAVHEEEFGGQYVFHRALSLDVLGSLPPMDAALVDGDHNWYTVVNELRLLRDVAREHGADLPVLLLHDVGWPYGRRDLYYDPGTIPEEHRRDWRRAGMEPGKVRLLPYGAGLNPTLANAKVEGGRRNGVMTALEDFVAEHDRPMRVVVLPIYFGLAIAVEQERLERQPALAAELDRLESPAGKDQLLALAEDIRLRALIFQHRIYFDREASVDRLARRYLGQLRVGPVGSTVAPEVLEDLEARLDACRRDLVRGDLVAVGLDPPGPAVFLGGYLDAHDQTDRSLWLADDAEGAVDAVTAALAPMELGPDRARVLGASGPGPGAVALVHVGPGAGTGSGPAVDRAVAALAPGGVVVLDGSADPALTRVVVDAVARGGLVGGGEGADPPGGRAWRRPSAPATDRPPDRRPDRVETAAAPG